MVRRRDGGESNWRIPSSTLQQAVPLFNAVGMQVDHASIGTWFYPSLRDTAAVTFGAKWDAALKAITGGSRLYGRDDLSWLRQFLDEILEDQEAGREVPDVGLSAVLFARHEWVPVGDEEEGERERVTKEIQHVESVDFVFGPGAEGRLREVLSLFNRFSVVGGVTMPDEITTNEESPPNPPQGGASQAQAPPAPSPNPVSDPGQASADTAMLQQRIGVIEQSMERLTGTMERLTGLLATAEDSGVVEGMGQAPRGQGGRISGGFNSLDQISAAYHRLMGLEPEGQDDRRYDGPLHQLTGIKELYIMLTGDRGMRGEFRPDLMPVFLAYSSGGNNADTSTMAELTRNVMNKVLVEQTGLLDEYYWWRNIARIENLTSLQQVSWVRYGGIGYDSGTGLPTVAEKGEYQQLLWEDERTTADWVKKGGYLPLSMEMIDRDDVMAWRDVPRQLAVAQAVTISSVFSALFTDNSGAGADLSDGVGNGYLFNTTRGNLITQPLDQTNWNLAVNTMYKLAQLKNSTQTEDRRIAARPKFALVPIELEGQAVSELSTDVKSGASNAQRTPVKRSLPEENVITVPHWTDSDNWAAVADPNLCPIAGVAFRFGEQPEIFMPTAGNHVLWLHDVLPIKTRWFFAVSAIDPRGAIKSNN